MHDDDRKPVRVTNVGDVPFIVAGRHLIQVSNITNADLMAGSGAKDVVIALATSEECILLTGAEADGFRDLLDEM